MAISNVQKHGIEERLEEVKHEELSNAIRLVDNIRREEFDREEKIHLERERASKERAAERRRLKEELERDVELIRNSEMDRVLALRSQKAPFSIHPGIFDSTIPPETDESKQRRKQASLLSEWRSAVEAEKERVANIRSTNLQNYFDARASPFIGEPSEWKATGSARADGIISSRRHRRVCGGKRRAGRKRVVSDVFSCFYPWLIKDARLRRLVDDHGRRRAVRDRDAMPPCRRPWSPPIRIFRPSGACARCIPGCRVTRSSGGDRARLCCIFASLRCRRIAAARAPLHDAPVGALRGARVRADQQSQLDGHRIAITQRPTGYTVHHCTRVDVVTHTCTCKLQLEEKWLSWRSLHSLQPALPW